jgi:hypothetical protein
MDWAEPKNIREWIFRSFSLRPILTLLLIFGILISELRFDWMEQMMGAFLTNTNVRRPESGAIWEINRQTETARRTLEKIVTDRQSSQREARSSKSFIEISDNLAPDQGAMLSPDDFRRLYLGLPTLISQEIISSYEILKIFSEDRFTRAYLEKEGNGLQVYFLDAENRVLRRLLIGANLLELISQNERAVDGTLDSFPKFKNRVYTADQFLSVLASLPDDSRRNVLPQPERLLVAAGRIVRVGISDETISGNIELGFEIKAGALTKVVFMLGREWAVWQIRSKLEGKRADAAPLIDSKP